MADETIELLKNYEPSKMHWPALHQEKIDGVPVRVFKKEGKVFALTRQGERVTSIQHIERFASVLLEDGESVVMELHIKDKPFKEISGHVRKKNVQCPALVGWVFDFEYGTLTVMTYVTRMAAFRARLGTALDRCGAYPEDLCIRIIPWVLVADAASAEEAHDQLMRANPNAEGSVLHSVHKTFQPGKRCWGTQRMKPVPTIDLMVVGFEEAISAEGQPLGMVGRINAEFTGADGKTSIIGIGPGALNHTERKNLWRMWTRKQFTPTIAEIRYMRDDSYDALRQPTFKCWRDDKKEADYVR